MPAHKNEVNVHSMQMTTDRSYGIPREYICGGMASMINVVFVFPLHKTVFFQQLDGITWTESVQRMRKDGVRRLYRGVLPPLLQRGTSSAAMFGFQSQTQRFLTNSPHATEIPDSFKLIFSAIMAGCLEASLTPFERVQALLQSPKYSHVYKNATHALSILYKYHGFRELYRGFTPIILRNCIGNVIYFSGKNWLFDKSHSAELPSGQRLASNFLIGGLLGSTIGACLLPLNVAKARLQSNVGTDFASLGWALRSLLNERKSRLFSGLPANFSRSMVSWGIITMVYEWLLHL